MATLTAQIPIAGTPINIGTFGNPKTVQVVGSFNGALNLEIGPTTSGPWTQLKTFYQPASDFDMVFAARFIRVSQSGAFSGSPSVWISAPSAATEAVATGVGTFGELRTSELSPLTQIEFSYGIDPNKLVTFPFGGGVASVSGALLSVSTTGAIGDAILARTKRPVTYAPGQGTVIRFTAKFNTPVLGHDQVAGAFGGSENDMLVGYAAADTRFFFMRRFNGAREIQTLTLSAGAGGVETATITLNGVPYNVPLTAGSAAATAEQIALFGAGGTFVGWQVYALGNTVVFLFGFDTPLPGAFSFSSTGTAAGAFVQTIAGVTATQDIHYQEDWNIDPMDGSGPSGQVLDPQNGNVFEMKMQYLGFGSLTLSIEDSVTGLFQPVHMIEYANQNPTPLFTNSVFFPGIFARDVSAGVAKTVSTASMAGFVDGRSDILGASYGESNAVTGVTTIVPILSIRNGIARNNKANFRQCVLKFLSAIQTSGKFIRVELVLNSTLTGALWSMVDPNSMMHVDKAATAFAGGTVIAVFTSGTVNLSPLEIDMAVGDVITLAAESAGGGAAADVLGAFSWVEDI